jgi:hypothetical protein
VQGISSYDTQQMLALMQQNFGVAANVRLAGLGGGATPFLELYIPLARYLSPSADQRPPSADAVLEGVLRKLGLFFAVLVLAALVIHIHNLSPATRRRIFCAMLGWLWPLSYLC